MFSQVKRVYTKGDEGPVSLSVALAYVDCFSGSGSFPPPGESRPQHVRALTHCLREFPRVRVQP